MHTQGFSSHRVINGQSDTWAEVIESMGEKFRKAIRDAGVIGCGGAGFPTHVKLKAGVDCVIANGAECEPLLRCDKHLMIHQGADIIKGLIIAMESTGAREGFIALKRKHKDAVAALEKRLKVTKNRAIRLFLLDNFYPAGDEQILVEEVLGRIVPEGGLPLDVGVVVNNVGTLMQVARAIEGENVTQRMVTITGEVNKPATLSLPIGTPVSRCIELCGGTQLPDYEVISGGPMMGKLVNISDSVVTKTTSGLIVLPPDHWAVRVRQRPLWTDVKLAVAACIQCQQCTDVCPRKNLGKYVYPDRIMKGIAYGITARSEDMTTAMLCVECGLCTYYGCPMGLNPAGMMSYVKKELMGKGLKNPHRNVELKCHRYRELRKVPLKRIMARMDLLRYEKDAPQNSEYDVGEEVIYVKIPLKQHIGAPSRPLVKVGEMVQEGQLIAGIPHNALGANYHASITGRVVRVGEFIAIEKVD